MKKLITLIVSICIYATLQGQDVERSRPAEWDGLIKGAAFVDRFLPMPEMTISDTSIWGTEGVQGRYVDNGLEDNEWSYWGGNIMKGNDSKYHTYLCRWREDAPKGHMQWPWSEVVHATAENAYGPYTALDVVGDGHNPEVQQLKDGRYFLYVNGSYFLSESLDGPWEKYDFEYDQRERPVFDHLANFTFVKREDGSFIMISRGGGVWLSQSGLPPYEKVSAKTIYPPYDGKYEDPVVWRTNVQYHLIVNDWLGRIAYYMRSKDGIDWKLEAGEAYAPGIVKHHDGVVENWYKFERIKVLQDDYGRACLANFAVADTLKHYDLGSDNHSSKNIVLPLVKGKLIELLNVEVTEETKLLRVLIKAEDDFNPQKDIKLNSLRFGATEEVSFGRGCKLLKTEKQGDDLLLIFDAKGHGFTDVNFAGKLLGETKKGELLFAWSQLPWIDYNTAVLSAKYPQLLLNGNHLKIEIEVQNFGQVASKEATLKIEYQKDGKWNLLSEGKVPILASFEKRTLHSSAKKFQSEELTHIRVTIIDDNSRPRIFDGNVLIR